MISIVIVNYNSGHFLQKCLNSISKYAGDDFEVIVVDNNSTDDSLRMCDTIFMMPKFRLIELSKNLGFAKANNIGAEECKGNIIHFLNPDTELRAGMASDYYRCHEKPNYIYLNKLQNPDNTFMESKNLIPTLGNFVSHLIGLNKCKYWYTGASVIISKENFIKIGKWNESFFMYAEDLDLFYKASLSKIETIFLPTIITHVGGGSSSKVWNSYEREYKVQKSFKLFYAENHMKWQYPFVLFLTFIRTLYVNPRKAKLLIRIWWNLNVTNKLALS